ncbi:hypothetical protein BH23CHL2_BH23CHL2_36470 [soil metagenome]
MWGDVWTVIWRDLRMYRAQFDEPRRLALGVGASFAFLVAMELFFGIHEQIDRASPVLLIWVWCWLPLGSAVTLSTDAVAGERERHTLESLLATRLPARAILIGKVLAVTVQSWISALALAAGALIALNLVTIWSGDLVIYPASVMVAGPLVSLLLTLLGTLVALVLSIDAETVRQANFRILIATSLLPVLIIFPIALAVLVAVLALGILVQFTDFTVSRGSLSMSSGIISVAYLFAISALLLVIAGAYLVTVRRFTRERMLRVGSSTPTTTSDESRQYQAQATAPRFRIARSPLARPDRLAISSSESRWLMILRDARVVAWKELVEVRGLLREWRWWLIIAGLVLISMVVQLSAVGSWYWSRDADTSLVFWLAMAAAIPIFIAQRSADAIAGERERRTGEILFTTRLNHTGILLGKLAVVALLPWTIALTIPIIGLLTTNLIHAGSGIHWYPPEVLLAGLGLTLGVATLFASGGLLASLTAPTVQHAARRISWFLMPILIAPGLVLRSTSLSGEMTANGELDPGGQLDFVASGELAVYVILGVPLLALVAGGFILILVSRFKRGTTVFD